MKNYIRVQHTFKAEPMTHREAAKILGDECSGSHTDRNGYIVEWEDGFRTWMPKNYFENEFVCNDTYLDRLRIESTDATERLERLTDAMRQDGVREKVGEKQYSLMQKQLNIMLEYIRILNARIAADEEQTR